MAIKGKITSLYTDKTMSEALLPRTNTKAVTDDKGVNLNAILDQVAYVDTKNSEVAVAPLNADTLAGFPADNYASKTYVSTEIAKAQLGGGSGEGDIDLSGFATKDDIATSANTTLDNAKTYTNDKIANIDYPVDSVNSKTGNVQLSAGDIGARPDTWLPTIAEIGAAPAGFGLGVGAAYKNWNDVDSLYENGTYYFSNISIPGVTAEYGVLVVSGIDTSFVFQTLYPLTTSNSCLRRQSYSGTWKPWEWVNPPMLTGVEYRTTERINGKAVYKKNDGTCTLYRLDGETEWKKQNDLMGAAPAEFINHAFGTNGLCTNLLLIDPVNQYGAANKPQRISTSNVTTISNCPVGNGFPTSGPFIASRNVDWYEQNRCVVTIQEAYPIAGRTWINHYNVSSWDGWKCVNPMSNTTILAAGTHYGSELPAAGTPGRLFFKVVE